MHEMHTSRYAPIVRTRQKKQLFNSRTSSSIWKAHKLNWFQAQPAWILFPLIPTFWPCKNYLDCVTLKQGHDLAKTTTRVAAERRWVKRGGWDKCWQRQAPSPSVCSPLLTSNHGEAIVWLLLKAGSGFLVLKRQKMCSKTWWSKVKDRFNVLAVV